MTTILSESSGVKDATASKKVLITGVSKGLGRALALELANRGHTIIGCSRDQTKLHSLQQQLAKVSSTKHLLFNLDVVCKSSSIFFLALFYAFHMFEICWCRNSNGVKCTWRSREYIILLGRDMHETCSTSYASYSLCPNFNVYYNTILSLKAAGLCRDQTARLKSLQEQLWKMN